MKHSFRRRAFVQYRRESLFHVLFLLLSSPEAIFLSLQDPLPPHDDAFGLDLGLDFDTGLEGPLPDLGASSSSGGHASIAGVAGDSRPVPIPNSGDLNRAREGIPETSAGVGEFEFEGNDFMDADLSLP